MKDLSQQYFDALGFFVGAAAWVVLGILLFILFIIFGLDKK